MTRASSPEAAEIVIERSVQSAGGLEALAAELSLFASPGMAVLLRGELGAGKSTFARAFIRALLPLDSSIDIPSPTYTLLQTYRETRIPVAHADLFRIGSAGEVEELGLDDLLADHAVLVEWPDRLGDVPWPDRLDVEISGQGSERLLRLRGKGQWARALERNSRIAEFIAGTTWKNAKREFLEGDASFRRYETLRTASSSVVLMDMPARPDGPPVKDGKPYSAIAHLAEDIGAVVAINGKLTELGYSAPKTEACDIAAGLAIIEDLGREVFTQKYRDRHDMREPMKAAVDVLADMAKRQWPETVSMTDGQRYAVPPYDSEAQLIEADLLPSWFWLYLHGIEVPGDVREEFAALWSSVLPFARPELPVWTLRDYHSPNLLWLPDRRGISRVGIIDTQDCVLGHPAYDLASLLQDARVDIDFEWADELFEHYCILRETGFDRAGFAAAYAILGAQRATKILGIFARLSKRDGKHVYLNHLPRVSRYLERNLAHPRLAGLKSWFDRHLPPRIREARR